MGNRTDLEITMKVSLTRRTVVAEHRERMRETHMNNVEYEVAPEGLCIGASLVSDEDYSIRRR
jgi:hypothetical protein